MSLSFSYMAPGSSDSWSIVSEIPRCSSDDRQHSINCTCYGPNERPIKATVTVTGPAGKEMPLLVADVLGVITDQTFTNTPPPAPGPDPVIIKDI